MIWIPAISALLTVCTADYHSLIPHNPHTPQHLKWELGDQYGMTLSHDSKIATPRTLFPELRLKLMGYLHMEWRKNDNHL